MQSTVGWNYNNQSLDEAGIQIEDLYYFASFRKGLNCYAHFPSKFFFSSSHFTYSISWS